MVALPLARLSVVVGSILRGNAVFAAPLLEGIALEGHERVPTGSDGMLLLLGWITPKLIEADANEFYLTVEFIMKLAFSAFLVIIGGVFSGLTLGLMGLDMVNLQGQSKF